MQTGIQEKTTFLQSSKKLSGSQLFTDDLKIPASLLLLLAFTGLLVLYQHTPAAAQEQSSKPARQHEEGGLLIGEGRDIES